jgi:DNA-binding transcriptional LysR family regulator
MPSAAADRLAAMNAFGRVVEAGPFTKAADTLNLPDASVCIARRVRSLIETAYRATFHRDTIALQMWLLNSTVR